MVSGWFRSRSRMNDEPTPASVPLAAIQGDSDSEIRWISPGA